MGRRRSFPDQGGDGMSKRKFLAAFAINVETTRLSRPRWRRSDFRDQGKTSFSEQDGDCATFQTAGRAVVWKVAQSLSLIVREINAVSNSDLESGPFSPQSQKPLKLFPGCADSTCWSLKSRNLRLSRVSTSPPLRRLHLSRKNHANFVLDRAKYTLLAFQATAFQATAWSRRD